MNTEFDAYIFDLDGTLLDTLPDLVVLTNRALEECGLPTRTTEEILSYVGNGVSALMEQAVPPGTSEQTTAKALSLWRELYPEFGAQHTVPYEGIPEVLAQLQHAGRKLAVLSNKFDKGTKGLIECFFPGVFSVVYGVGEGIPRKPDPAGLLRVIDELETQPNRAVYVGDSPSDCLTAERAGCSCLCVNWGYHSKENLVDAGVLHSISSPNQIFQE